MKPVRVEPEAKRELAAATAWYEERREGLGREFLAEVDAVLIAIARNPVGFHCTRAWLATSEFVVPPLEGFLIRSRSSIPNVVRVLAIAHDRRRPGYWVGRLKQR